MKTQFLVANTDAIEQEPASTDLENAIALTMEELSFVGGGEAGINIA